MKRNENFLNKVIETKEFGKVEVISLVKNSRTKVKIKEIDKGKGWSETERKYTGVKYRNGWVRGENTGYGKVHEVHIKELK